MPEVTEENRKERALMQWPYCSNRLRAIGQEVINLQKETPYFRVGVPHADLYKVCLFVLLCLSGRAQAKTDNL